MSLSKTPRPASRRKPAQGELLYRTDPSDSGVRMRLVAAGFALIVVVFAGTLGYWLLGKGNWPVDDCVYMVLITLTTVGYAEVLPLTTTEHGRTFTMFVMLGGMGVSFYFLSALTAFVIEGDLREVLWRRRMNKRIAGLSGHYIVCGAGRTGRHVIEELLREKSTVVVIERDADQLKQLVKTVGADFIAIMGDATDDRVLVDARVEHSAGLVTTLGLDQDNLFVAMSARELRPNLRIVSRASERAGDKLLRAGANVVINPMHIGGRRMAHELLRPTVVGFLDFMVRDVERDLVIEEIEVAKAGPLADRTLADSRIREVSNALVLAVLRGTEQTYNPPPTFTLEAGMTLIALGEREQIERLRQHARGDG
ncbi:MAG: potassium channel protein [Myxococcales bacterium]|nr:potassium channel protein [Myxococcales bacterium]